MHRLTFGEAVDAAKQGNVIVREGWNGKGMFVFMRPGDELPVNTLLSVKSLPKKVKDYYELKHMPITHGKNPWIKFTPYLCMKTADDNIVNGWLPSQTDILTEDWSVINGFDFI